MKETPKPSRTERAFINVIFTYANLLLGILFAYFSTPTILHRIGTREYGFWLSTGELLGYAWLMDLGVLSLLPWLIAEARGKGDPAKILWLLAQARAMSGAVMLGLIMVTILTGYLLSLNSKMDLELWRGIIWPLFIQVTLMNIGFLFIPYQALLTGIQDVTFLGASALVKGILSFTLVITLLLQGDELYALAFSVGIPHVTVLFAAFVRARFIVPQYCGKWPRASFRSLGSMFSESIGPWMSNLGVGLIERSQAIIITSFGHPELAPIYQGTAKLTQVLSNLPSTLIDSALVGLAELSGETKSHERRQKVVIALLKLQLLGSGLVSVVALADNPSFVTLWIGHKFFGGITLNALFCALLVVTGLSYSVIKASYTQAEGNQRLVLGSVALKQGLVQVIISILLYSAFGLTGLVAGAILAVLSVTFRDSCAMLKKQISLGLKDIVRLVFWPWFLRVWFLFAMSFGIGIEFHPSHIWELIPPTLFISGAYGYLTHSYWKELPFPEKIRRLVNYLDK